MQFKTDNSFLKLAGYIIWRFQDVGEPITNLKLQKLLYYAQGWYLAIYDEPLFTNKIEAWVHGPVVPDAYHHFKAFKYAPISIEQKRPDLPGSRTKNHLEEIIEVYGNFSAFELEHLTHQSDPWIRARNGIPPDESSNSEILLIEMSKYFKKKLEKQNETQK